MKHNSKIGVLNLLIAIMFFGLAISNFDLFDIEIHPTFARTFFLITGLLYFFKFLMKKERKTIDSTKMILVVLWSIYGSYILSKLIGFMPHIIALIVLGIVWLFQEFKIQVEEPKKNIQFNWLRNIGISFLIIQFIFEIQQWPFAGPVTILATAGYIMIGISFIREFRFNLNKKSI